MSDFSEAKIYKITNLKTGKVYVGSTCRPIEYRYSAHISASIQGLKSPLYVDMREYGIDNFKLELVENYECKCKEALLSREQYWIDQLKANGILNRNRAWQHPPVSQNEKCENITKSTDPEYGRQYRKNNKKTLYENRKKYEETHREQLNAKSKERYRKKKEAQGQIVLKTGRPKKFESVEQRQAFYDTQRKQNSAKRKQAKTLLRPIWISMLSHVMSNGINQLPPDIKDSINKLLS